MVCRITGGVTTRPLGLVTNINVFGADAYSGRPSLQRSREAQSHIALDRHALVRWPPACKKPYETDSTRTEMAHKIVREAAVLDLVKRLAIGMCKERRCFPLSRQGFWHLLISICKHDHVRAQLAVHAATPSPIIPLRFRCRDHLQTHNPRHPPHPPTHPRLPITDPVLSRLQHRATITTRSVQQKLGQGKQSIFIDMYPCHVPSDKAPLSCLFLQYLSIQRSKKTDLPGRGQHRRRTTRISTVLFSC